MIAAVIVLIFVVLAFIFITLDLKSGCDHWWTEYHYILTVNLSFEKYDLYISRCRKCGAVQHFAKDTTND